MEVHGCQVRKIYYLTAARQYIFHTWLIRASVCFNYFHVFKKKKDMCLKMILHLVHSLLISSLKMCNRQNYTESNGHFKVLKFKQLYKQESFIYHPSRCLPMSPYLFQKQYFLPIIETLSPLMISTSKLRTRTI